MPLRGYVAFFPLYLYVPEYVLAGFVWLWFWMGAVAGNHVHLEMSETTASISIVVSAFRSKVWCSFSSKWDVSHMWGSFSWSGEGNMFTKIQILNVFQKYNWHLVFAFIVKDRLFCLLVANLVGLLPPLLHKPPSPLVCAWHAFEYEYVSRYNGETCCCFSNSIVVHSYSCIFLHQFGASQSWPHCVFFLQICKLPCLLFRTRLNANALLLVLKKTCRGAALQRYTIAYWL